VAVASRRDCRYQCDAIAYMLDGIDCRNPVCTWRPDALTHPVVKLMIGGPLGRADGKPQRSCPSSTPCSRCRKTGAVSVGQISSRGSRLGAVTWNMTGVWIWLKAFQRGAIWYVVAEIVAHDQTLLVCAGARRLDARDAAIKPARATLRQ